ncbi:MAG: S8 family serine peptidase [Planctomycetota bacterium]|jgi:hypothetical protein
MAKANRILKVFCTKEEGKKLADKYGLIEKYEGFILFRATASEAKKLATRFPSEDITDQYTIQIGKRKINTNLPRVDAQGKTRAHSAYKGVKKLAPGKHHYLVQFIGPIKKTWLTRLKRLGAEPRAPFADFAYVVRCNERVLKKIAGLPFLRWMGHLSHRDRIVIAKAGTKLPRTRIMAGVFGIEFFGKQDMRKAAGAIRKLGFKILSRDEEVCFMSVELNSKSSRSGTLLDKLSAVHGVRAIRTVAMKRTSNDVATDIIDSDDVAGPPLNCTGKGEIVAVCDTGLDTGNRHTIHDDFQGRIVALRSYPINPMFDPYIDNPGDNDGAADLDSGHGTHVAGSVLSSGASSANLPGLTKLIRGPAFKAKLVFQAVEQELEWKSWQDEYYYGRYLLAGIPDNLKKLFWFAYRKGARIHSNSWGGGDPGEYDAQCQQLDDFVWRRKDFCVVCAAGNDGTDHDGDGTINLMSVTSPATAKNCITVGACESKRPQFNSDTYGSWWPSDYPAAPYNNDPMADDPTDIVAFSSRGPTQDGRIKPDIVAPGTFILSTRSRRISPTNHAWSAFPPSNMYFYMGGTSMATPLVSGVLAQLREYLRKRVGYTSPSAALMKACLILGAHILGRSGRWTRVHDNHQGYGRVDLRNSIEPKSPMLTYYMDDREGLNTGQSDEFKIKVRSTNYPLRIAMAYSDYPGPSLVNNLNIMLIDPHNRYYVGNALGPGYLAMDNTNNTEVIHVQRPRKGTWRIRVIGSNVPHGKQEYAFAVQGHVIT